MAEINSAIPMSVNSAPMGTGLEWLTGMQKRQQVDQTEQQTKMRDMQMRQSILAQAMQQGASSPQDWDAAMHAAIEAGAPEAERYIGAWTPERARQAPAQGFGGGGGAVPEQGLDRATGRAAPSPGGAPAGGGGGGSDPYDAAIMQQIRRLTPEQRQQSLDHVSTGLQMMETVRSVEELPQLLDNLVEAGVDPKTVASFRAHWGGPMPWKNFLDSKDKLKAYAEHLSDATMYGGMGVEPRGPQSTFGVHFGGKGEPNLITETPAEGGRPIVSYADVRGTPPRGASAGRPELSSEEKNFMQAEDDLRVRFEQQNADFAVVRDAFANLAHMPASVPGQMGTVFGIMKLFDPTSSVREGEYATARNTQSVPDMLRNIYNTTVKKQILSPEQIKEFKEVAAKLYEQRLRSYKAREKEYRGIAQRRRLNLDNAVPDMTYGINPKEIIDAPPVDVIDENDLGR